jgi:hypothetical protein
MTQREQFEEWFKSVQKSSMQIPMGFWEAWKAAQEAKEKELQNVSKS